MFDWYRSRNPGRPVWKMLFYGFWWTLSRITLALFYRLRITGSENVPASGPVLYVLNHQSHLDPIIAGMASPRRHTNFIAKSTLFKSKLFGRFLSGLNSVPIKQGSADMGAIRTALEQLAMGRIVLIFPEGSRTPDGAMHTFKRGAWLILSKGKPTVLPAAIEGAFDAWPRKRSFPFLFGKRLAVHVGKPIPSQTLLEMGPDQGLAHLRQTIEDLRLRAAAELTARGVTLTTRPMVDTESQ